MAPPCCAPSSLKLPHNVSMLILYRHHTDEDLIELDPETGHWRHIDEDDHPSPGCLSIALRHSYPVRGSYAIENGRRYCLYWLDRVLVLRTADERQYRLFRFDGVRYHDLRAGVRIELDTDAARPGHNTLSIIDASGAYSHRLVYDAVPYLRLYGYDFTYAPDRDLSDWDFFIGLLRGIDELAALSGAVAEKPSPPAGKI